MSVSASKRCKASGSTKRASARTGPSPAGVSNSATGTPGQDKAYDMNALEGPVVDAEGRTDVVNDQKQVDDLLASLGF